MRTLIAVLTIVAMPAMAADANPPVTSPPPAAQAPQCYSGDAGKFFNVGEKTKIASIEVVCTEAADKKSAFWTNPNEKK